MKNIEYRTPLYRLGSDEYGNTFYIKRDDLLPVSFGGNKARIAAEYLKDMRVGGWNHMICYGNARSNLCRVLSSLCCAEHIPCTILSPADDDGSRRETANQKMCSIAMADIMYCDKKNVAACVEETLNTISARGDKPYYIYGNTLGTGRMEIPVRAYVPILTEIMTQCASLGFEPDRIALPLGTGSTVAGLLCGLEGQSSSRKPVIHGFSIAREKESAAAHVRDYVTAWAESTGQEAGFTDNSLLRFVINDEWRESYGHCGEDTIRFIEAFYRSYGIATDPTYTGKAYHALFEMIRTSEKIHGENIVLLHTGGTPLFFDMIAR